MLSVDVIGGSGFIGSRLCRRLVARGDVSVQILDKALSRSFREISRRADVRSRDDLRKNMRGDAILINLAAEHRDDVTPVSLYDEVNVAGARNICEIAREKDVSTIVFTSSVAVYGFAPVGTDESGRIAPFGHYGRTKYEAELVFRAWQEESPGARTLVIVRPTVVFGEQNRGNVYNLIRQIASGLFVMVGSGRNRKSMAYVENVASFIEFSMGLNPGVHVYNYIDKPDFTMNALVMKVKASLGKPAEIRVRLPFWMAYSLGKLSDLVAVVARRPMPISSIRVQKFCADSVYSSAVSGLRFVPPVALEEAINRTIQHDFLDEHEGEEVFISE